MSKTLAIAVMTLLGSAAFAAGEVYRWKDVGGIWHYSDQPHAGAELVRGPTSSAVNSTPPAQTAATPPAATTTSDPLPVSKEVAQEVRQEASAAKAKRCEKGKADYEQMMQKDRFKRTDAQGNVTFLSAAEIDATRLQARANRDLACGT
ncbi:MAG: DUF4124 domain-containing protein [Pseudomonadota bacterium]